MRTLFFLCCLLLFVVAVSKAQTVVQIKTELAASKDPLGYVKFKIKKTYKVDTVSIVSTSSFVNFGDSIAYYGQVGNVYGPFKSKNGKSYLLEILGKASNTFYHVAHILLDTTTFQKKFVNALADTIISKIESGRATFEEMAITYSSDNTSGSKGGDLGWFCRGVMLPQLDVAIQSHKKGDVFKVWTNMGLHVVTVKDNPKKDTGFALMLRVLL
ncbi:MAG TPA: peptidylprolyl isomerase [Ferruginibacter sp.]|jgi:parvulin-like peptidyl-prolyl isomerase|nr:peptidylprolyl isomerase [Ferruginibacter sp.]